MKHLPRSIGFQQELERLLIAISPTLADGSWAYGIQFENETFSTFPYYWGDCTCDSCEENDYACEPSCLSMRPNFYFKPTDLKITWYKYILRGGETNQSIDLSDFKIIIDRCIDSLK
jgi:hypothetical protein